MLYRSILFAGVASSAAFQATPARQLQLPAQRCASPVAIELPSLPKLELPGLPDSVSDILAYKPKAWKKNENTFDKDGRLIKGPKVDRKIQSQVTKDNTK